MLDRCLVFHNYMQKTFPEKLIVVQVDKKFAAFYKIRIHRHVPKSPPLDPTVYSDSISSAQNRVVLRCLSILSSHLRLKLPSILLHLGSPTKIMYAFITYACCMTRPTHPLLFCLLTDTLLRLQITTRFVTRLCNESRGMLPNFTCSS
jgi:hypothetical protein